MGCFRCVLISLALSQPLFAETDTEIRALIEKLGSGSYQERQSASRKLFLLGETAVPVLQQYENHPDRELRTRARGLAHLPVRVWSYEELQDALAEKIKEDAVEKSLIALREKIAAKLQTYERGPMEDLFALLRSSIDVRRTPTKYYFFTRREDVRDELLSKIGMGVVQQDGTALLRWQGRSVRLEIDTSHEGSLGLTPIFSKTYCLADIVGNAVAENGRPIQNVTVNGDVIDATRKFDLRPHAFWYLHSVDSTDTNIEHSIEGEGFEDNVLWGEAPDLAAYAIRGLFRLPAQVLSP